MKGGRLIYNYLRKSVLDDKPYNEFATELLAGSGNLYFQPLANFMYVDEFAAPENYATNVSQVFLGVRLQCAQCHNHPWEKWTQDDFWGFAAFFARMGVKNDTYQGDESQIHLKLKGEVINPRIKKAVMAKYLDGPTQAEGLDKDIRDKLAAWMTAPENPWFSRAIVNRIMQHYLGRGLVEPVEDFRVTNPASNQALLDTLARDFVSNGYSLRHTIRLILNSRVHQLSSEPNETNRDDQINYSRYYLKRLMAEQLIDAITVVTGVPEKYAGFPLGTRAMSIPRGAPSYFLTAFGRARTREVICERDTLPAITQMMHLISGDTLQRQITSKNSQLTKWVNDATVSNEEIVKRLFLSALVRPPDDREVSLVVNSAGTQSGDARRKVFEDTLWAPSTQRISFTTTRRKLSWGTSAAVPSSKSALSAPSASSAWAMRYGCRLNRQHRLAATSRYLGSQARRGFPLPQPVRFDRNQGQRNTHLRATPEDRRASRQVCNYPLGHP